MKSAACFLVEGEALLPVMTAEMLKELERCSFGTAMLYQIGAAAPIATSPAVTTFAASEAIQTVEQASFSIIIGSTARIGK